MNKLFFLALCFSSVGCQSKHSQKPDLERGTSRAVVRDVPEWYLTKSPEHQWDKTLFKLLNLGSLENGFDSLQIRIWIDCGYKAASLIVIERTKNKWDATFYFFTAHYDEDFNLSIQNLETERKSPKSGWKNFSDNLLNTGLIDLPDFTKFLSKYNYPTHADETLVEIGTPKKYRLYVYPELGLNNKIAGGPANLHEALQLIEREFDFRRPCQDAPGSR